MVYTYHMVKCTLQKTGWLMGGHPTMQVTRFLRDDDGRRRTHADGRGRDVQQLLLSRGWGGGDEGNE